MIDGFEIRPLTDDEVEVVCEELSERSGAQHRERLAGQQQGGQLYLIAWAGSTPVGHVILVFPSDRWIRRLAERGDPAAVEDLAVLPRHRRRGVGRGLMEAAEIEARARSFEVLRLATGLDEGSVPARGLYRSLGYVEEPDSLFIESALIPTDDGTRRVWMDTLTSWRKRLE